MWTSCWTEGRFHLDVLHLHLIQLLLLLRGVTIHQVVLLPWDGRILFFLVGRGRQRAVGDLGVVALVGEVTEAFVLKLHHSSTVRHSFNKPWEEHLIILQLPVRQPTLLLLHLCRPRSSSPRSPSSSPSAHWGAAWLCAEDPADLISTFNIGGGPVRTG